MVTTRVSLDEVWSWFRDVPDPEIPVISIVDLGIVRDVYWAGDTLQVTVTPTYSGCPATAVIDMQIDAALRAKGIGDVALVRQIVPPWTTDWLSAEGRTRFEASASRHRAPLAGPNGARAAAHLTSNGSVNSARRRARHNGAVRCAWNRSTTSNASDGRTTP